MVILLGWMIHINRQEVKRLRTIKRELSRANEAKEIYLARFLELCASSIESMDDYTKTCRRRAAVGQLDEAIKFMQDGSPVDHLRQTFYNLFDEAFLKIYPTFVAEINSLLLPDRRIEPPSHSELTTELRIVAFSRLGVEDTSKIARFLGISTNTVYTYRNKLRNRASNRDSFDEQMRRICTTLDD